MPFCAFTQIHVTWPNSGYEYRAVLCTHTAPHAVAQLQMQGLSLSVCPHSPTLDGLPPAASVAPFHVPTCSTRVWRHRLIKTNHHPSTAVRQKKSDLTPRQRVPHVPLKPAPSHSVCTINHILDYSCQPSPCIEDWIQGCWNAGIGCGKE